MHICDINLGNPNKIFAKIRGLIMFIYGGGEFKTMVLNSPPGQEYKYSSVPLFMLFLRHRMFLLGTSALVLNLPPP